MQTAVAAGSEANSLGVDLKRVQTCVYATNDSSTPMPPSAVARGADA